MKTSNTLCCLVGLFVAHLAFADDWIPYTDGRVGGCFSGHGTLYGCTPQPNPVSGQITGDSLKSRELREMSDANEKLRQERDARDAEANEQRQRADAAERALQQSQDQARQGAADTQAAADRQQEAAQQAWLQSAEGQAALKAQDDQRKAELAQQQQIHEMFQNDTDLKTCAQRKGIVNCNDQGCLCENAEKH